MHDTTRLRKYRSTGSGRERQALEYLVLVHDAGGLDKALCELADRSEGVAFVVVNLRGTHLLTAAEIAHVLDTRLPMLGAPRLCIAGSHAALCRLGPKAIDFDHVGLMLDRVDADTPPAQLIWDRIEAVRFAPAFLTQAARTLRLGCALEAMLVLSKAMGLCTLGTDALPQGACISGNVAFDYLPASPPAPADARRAVPSAGVAQARVASRSRGGEALSR